MLNRRTVRSIYETSGAATRDLTMIERANAAPSNVYLARANDQLDAGW
jgi:hypothetical protein